MIAITSFSLSFLLKEIYIKKIVDLKITLHNFHYRQKSNFELLKHIIT